MILYLAEKKKEIKDPTDYAFLVGTQHRNDEDGLHQTIRVLRSEMVSLLPIVDWSHM